MELPLSVTRRQAVAGAAVLLVVLAIAGRQLVGAGAAAGDAAALDVAALTAASNEPARVLVHVVGAVRSPGLYELAEGSRIADALERAGGTAEDADLEQVNLASPVADGTQIVVPAREPGAAPSPSGAAPAPAQIHLNSATVEELQTLPGVGPVTAQKIVDHRDKHGAFASVEELQAVSGIGPKRIEALRDLVVP